jgi:hypothetical protein
VPPIVIAIAAAAGFVLLALAALPAVLLARPAQRTRVRAASGRRLALCWVGALLPWTAALVTVAVRDRITVSLNSVPALVLALVALLALWALLVMLPVGVVTATLVWARARWNPRHLADR